MDTDWVSSSDSELEVEEQMQCYQNAFSNYIVSVECIREMLDSSLTECKECHSPQRFSRKASLGKDLDVKGSLAA